jgi:hypothetical protein
MAQPKRDPVREERIHNEVGVDAYGPEEQAMGWDYYLEDKIRFPFQATWIATKAVSPLLKGETIEVPGMAPEEACARDMLVLLKGQGRTMGVPWSQLQAVKANTATNEAIADWHYWLAQAYCFWPAAQPASNAPSPAESSQKTICIRIFTSR